MERLSIMRAWIGRIRLRASNTPPLCILAIAWLLAVAYAFPGYMNWDSGDQIYMARTQFYEDWHAPLMARYWRTIEHVVHGPFGMLVLQMTLFLGGLYGALRLRFRPRAAAVGAAALLLFPPILTPMAVVWKDAQMAGWMLAGFACALHRSPWVRGIAIVMLFFACGVRDNGAAALLPICVLMVSRWGFERRIKILAIAFGIFVTISSSGAIVNRTITVQRDYAWYKANAIHDLAGSLCYEDPMTDAEVRDALDGIPLLIKSNLQWNLCRQYNPRYWFPLTFGSNDIFVQMPDKADRLARLRAWFRAVREHPYGFLTHRWLVFRELLGLTEFGTEEPVCQTFAANADQLKRINHDASLSTYQRVLGNWFVWLTGTFLFRPWIYLLGCLFLAGYAIRKRDGLILTIVASGILYEGAYFIVAAGPAYRYSHWMVVCCCIATAIVFADRLRDGLARRRTST